MFEHVTTIEQLVAVAHQMAVAKGWWPDGPSGRPVVDQVNNFHSEVSESWEEWRAGRLDLWWSVDGRPVRVHCGTMHIVLIGNGHKPEGFWVEIADIVIRLCDTAGAYGWEIGNSESRTKEDRLPVMLKNLRRSIDMLECPYIDYWSSWAKRGWANIVQDCFAYSRNAGIDLWELIRLKLAYNATRSARHGGKLA